MIATHHGTESARVFFPETGCRSQSFPDIHPGLWFVLVWRQPITSVIVRYAGEGLLHAREQNRPFRKQGGRIGDGGMAGASRSRDVFRIPSHPIPPDSPCDRH